MKTISYGTVMRHLCAAIYDAAKRYQYFTVSDVRALLDDDVIAAAAPSRLIASALRAMSADGRLYLSPTKKYKKYNHIGHGRPVRVWESLVYREIA